MFHKMKIFLVAALVLGSASAVFATPNAHSGWKAPAVCMTDDGNGRMRPCDAPGF